VVVLTSEALDNLDQVGALGIGQRILLWSRQGRRRARWGYLIVVDYTDVGCVNRRFAC
jgi:hypothetical protein